MTTQLMVGILLTLVASGGMVAWAYHEVRRVDEVIGAVDTRLQRVVISPDDAVESGDGRLQDSQREEREVV